MDSPALVPAIRNALDVLGISPPGHRDTLEDVGRKLAAWEQLRDAVDQAEAQLANENAAALFALWCHPEAPRGQGYVHGLRCAFAVLGLSFSEPDPAAPTRHHYLSTGCYHGDHDYCRSMTGLAGAKRPASCKFCQAPCQCPCHAPGETGEGQ